MTVIASFRIDNNPFMISDILLSVENTAYTRSYFDKNILPTIDRFNQQLPHDSTYLIVDACQKTVKICDRFMLTYAGDVDQAVLLINHLRELTKEKAPTPELFAEWVNQLGRTNTINDLSFLVFIEDSNQIYLDGYKCAHFESQIFQNMRASGSGWEDILKEAEGYLGMKTNRALSAFEQGLGLSLFITARLLGKETVTGDPSKKAYGGAYEITYWNGKDFEKLDQVVHLHWFAKYSKAEGLSFNLPEKIQKLEYHDSVLYLRDIEFLDGEVNDYVYPVKSTGASVSDVEVLDIRPSLQYKWLINHVYILLENGKVRHRSQVNYVHDDNYKMLLDKKEAGLDIQFDPNAFDFMKDFQKELQTDEALK